MALLKQSDHSQQSSSQRFFLSLWYRSPRNKHLLSYLLIPFAYLLRGLACLRRHRLTRQAATLPVPVVIVGNIAIGGTGKTPVVIALVKALQEKGIRVGVISRGYGSLAPHYPYNVTADTEVDLSGDEALLIAQSVECPLVIDQDRVAAAEYLLQRHPDTQLIISDDGLQHYRLPRSLELVIIDGKRGMGNELCLPAGPLREPASRLKEVNWVFVNGAIENGALDERVALFTTPTQKGGNVASIQLQPMHWRHLLSGRTQPLNPLPWLSEKAPLVALAAIGNPQRFFTTLNSLGMPTEMETRAFDDHHHFTEADFSTLNDAIVVMTTKDAVKCRRFAQQNWWALEVSTQLPAAFVEDVVQLIN